MTYKGGLYVVLRHAPEHVSAEVRSWHRASSSVTLHPFFETGSFHWAWSLPTGYTGFLVSPMIFCLFSSERTDMCYQAQPFAGAGSVNSGLMLKKQALACLVSHLPSSSLSHFLLGTSVRLDHNTHQEPYVSLLTSLRPYLKVHTHSEVLGDERLPSQAKFYPKKKIQG